MFRKSFALGTALAAVLILSVILGAAVSAAAAPDRSSSSLAAAENPLAADTSRPVAVPGASAERADAKTALADQTNSIVLTAAADAYIDQSRPTTSFGGDISLLARQESGNTNQAALLVRFNLSNVPADAVIVSATLSLAAPRFAALTAPALAMSPYHLSSWAEFGRGGVTWNNKPTFTAMGDPSATYGGKGMSFDVTEIVSGWFGGSLPNNGIGIAPDLNAVGEAAFVSREGGTAPRLTLHYTLRSTLNPIQDSFVDGAYPTVNYDGLGYLRVWKSSSPYHNGQTLLGFDWGALPPYVAVSRATLEMYSEVNLAGLGPAGPAADELVARAIVSGWDEATVTYDNGPATLLVAQLTADYTPGYSGWTSWDVTPIVQGWASGALVPHGIAIGPNTLSGLAEFFDRSKVNSPRLTVEYITVPPPCEGLTSASISGATSGNPGVAYGFTSAYTPLTADGPLTYSWTATDLPPQSTPNASFSWTTTGTKQVGLSVSNCGGTVSSSWQVEIVDPPDTCPTGISGLALTAPMSLGRNWNTSVVASAQPPTLTRPITFTWQADGHSDYVQSVYDSVRSRSFSWPITGTKRLTVTAESCSGQVVRTHQIEVLDEGQMPDLSLGAYWFDEERGGYYTVLRNKSDIPAPAGHVTQMEAGGVEVVNQAYTETLPGNAVRALYLDYDWGCDGGYGQFHLHADSSYLLAEKNEGNNQINTYERCDQRSPEFLNGPLVITTTEQTAVISWQTNEPTRYRVLYRRFPYMNPLKQEGSDYQESRQVTLTGLERASSYSFYVEVRDEAGNLAGSRQMIFQTQPPGTDPPDVVNLDFHPWDSAFYEFWRVYADVADAQYVDRLEFYLDGKPLGTDYSPAAATYLNVPRYDAYISPQALGYNRSSFFRDLTLEVRAYALNGRSTVVSKTIRPVDPGQPAKLRFSYPRDGDTIYLRGARGANEDAFYASFDAAQTSWGCTWTGYSEGYEVPPGQSAVNCDDVAYRFKEIKVLLNGQQVGYDGSMPITQFQGLDILVRPTNFWPGSYEMVLQGFNNSGQLAAAYTQTVHLAEGEANVVVTRTVRRLDNRLQVDLLLKNEGTLPSRVDRVVDNIKSFQHLWDDVTEPTFAYKVRTGQAYFEGPEMVRRTQVLIDLEDGIKPYKELAPGESIRLQYMVVPVMYESATYAQADIGGLPVRLYVQEAGEDKVVQRSLPAVRAYDPDWQAQMSLGVAVQGATHASDFLLVTSPRRIYAVHVDQDPITGTKRYEAERLFATMAKLASLQQGVLAYTYSDDPHVLDNLIEPAGYWSRQMNTAFRQSDSGYVLLVGETEILPSWRVDSDDWSIHISAGRYIHYSDQHYANTGGNTSRPELVLGRLVGDSIWRLEVQLRNAIGVHLGEAGYRYRRDSALLINGDGEGNSSFAADMDYADQQLGSDYLVSRINWETQGTDGASRFNVLTNTLGFQDLIIYRGHGNKDVWSDGLNSGLAYTDTFDLAGNKAAAVAFACQAGDYEGDDDHNMPDALMYNDIVGYIGSTENSPRDANRKAARYFASHWEPWMSLGQALNAMERHVWGSNVSGDHGKYWAFEYNLYGSPKFGWTEPAAAQLGPEAALADSLNLFLPDLEITAFEDHHEVTIPGGGSILDLGSYEVPLYFYEQDLPAGTVLADVRLAHRGGLTVTSGLTMPVVTTGIDCPGCVEITASAASPTWTPTLDQRFTWMVEKNGDGTSTLWMTLFPFYYNSVTGDGLYYQEFTFELDVITTSVRALSLDLPGTAVLPGEALTASLQIANEGEAQDVVVQASVRAAASGDPADGLPLRTLGGLSGAAAVDLVWDSGAQAQGSYYLLVELLDSEGRLLDSVTADFDIGIVGGRMVDLTASSDRFNPGDPVSLTLTFENSGTMPYSGTASIQLQPQSGITDSVTFHVDSPVLAAGETWSHTVVWDSSGAAPGRWRVSGQVRYYSRSTDPLLLVLNEINRVYLPMLMKPSP